MVIVERLIRVFDDLDIEDVTIDKVLGDDLDMDSQELVCATEEVANAFSITLEDGELHRDMTVQELAVMISGKLVQPMISGDFDDHLVEDTVIPASTDKVYECLFEFEMWPERLPHVKDIRTHYDDGQYQEFDMDVESAEGKLISVRSVRRCQPGSISFFQPTPPEFLKHHSGDWVFHALDENTTHLLTRHQWKEKEADLREKGFADNSVHTLLSEHARFALDCWRQNLAKGMLQ